MGKYEVLLYGSHGITFKNMWCSWLSTPKRLPTPALSYYFLQALDQGCQTQFGSGAAWSKFILPRAKNGIKIIFFSKKKPSKKISFLKKTPSNKFSNFLFKEKTASKKFFFLNKNAIKNFLSVNLQQLHFFWAFQNHLAGRMHYI